MHKAIGEVVMERVFMTVVETGYVVAAVVELLVGFVEPTVVPDSMWWVVVCAVVVVVVEVE